MKRTLPRLFSAGIARSPLVIIAIVAILLIGGLYTFRLDSLIGPSNGETSTLTSLSTLGGISDNFLLLPYKLLTFSLLQLPADPLLLTRLSSVIITLASVALFFILAKRWYGLQNAVAATAIFAGSGWLLHTGRYGAGYGLLVLTVIGLLNLTVWLTSTERPNRAVVVFALVSSLALFVPGGLWFVLASAFICRQALTKHYKAASSSTKALTGLIIAVAAIILALAFVRDLSLIRQWLGLPAQLPGLIELAKQAMLSVSAFIIRGPGTPEVWLAHTPILDVASTVIFLLGVAFYSKHLRNPRTQLIMLFASLGVVLVALNGAPGLSYLVPVVYLVLAGGFAFFLHQWKKVFPRNPIAETTALTVLGILVVCIVGFHAQRYFVAWRFSPNTVEAYRQPAPDTDSRPYLIQ